MDKNTSSYNHSKVKNSKQNIGGTISINDLKEIEYNIENSELSHQERLALKNFDRYRIQELNKQPNETAFNKKYLELQALANLAPYQEFLKEKYFS